MEKLKAKYKLHATRVDRIAIVDRPAVPDAQMVVFKRFPDEDGAFFDLPMVGLEKDYNEKEAVARIIKWATNEEGKINFSDLTKAFMWYDKSKAEEVDSYKLPYTDIVEGKLHAVPKAIISIVGGHADITKGATISMVDKKKVLMHVKKYYEKMEMDFPQIALKSIEKYMGYGFVASFLYKATEGAVYALENAVLNTIYKEGGSEDIEKEINILFKEFSYVVNEVLAKVVSQNKADISEEERLTTEDVAKPFSRGLGYSAITESFSYFRNNLSWLMLSLDELKEPEKTLKQVTDIFKDFVIKNSTYIVQNKREDFEPIEKEGRVLSSARLRKLKETLSILSEIVSEAESRQEKSYKEGNGMEFKQEHLDMLEKTSADVGSISDSVSGLTKSLKASGLLKTEAEIKVEADAKIEADKKAEEAKVEADKKATADTEKAEQADLEKRFKDLGLEGDITKEAVEKKEQEIASEKAQFAQDLPAKLNSIDKAVKSFNKFVEVISKRFGYKTSVEEDEDITNKSGKQDPFGDVLKRK